VKFLRGLLLVVSFHAIAVGSDCKCLEGEGAMNNTHLVPIRALFSMLLLACLLVFQLIAQPLNSQAQKSDQLREIQSTAFVNVNVVPMDKEGVLLNQTVIVRKGRISEIGPTKQIKIPRNTVRIDGRGKYLMPGLVDMHTHITDDVAEGTPLASENGELLLYIANGVTTVRNMKGWPKHIRWRQQVASSEILGPTLYTCGPTVNGLQSAEEAKRTVKEQVKAGYDCIKVYSPPDWSQEAYEALIAAARELKIQAVGHFPRNLPFEVALNTGQASVDHAEEFLYTHFFKLKRKIDATIISDAAKATRNSGISVTTTLVTYKHIALQLGDETFQNLLRKPELKYVPQSIRHRGESATLNGYRKQHSPDKAPLFMRSLDLQKRVIKAFHNAGVRIMLGTDSSWNLHFVVAGFSVHEELLELIDAGLSPYEALRTATVNPAEFLHASREFGTVSVGKRADLILVAGNPLESVNYASQPIGVMLRGRWLPSTELQQRLEVLAAAYATK
jgi:imidazolonepropionase-like amidohydrolase